VTGVGPALDGDRLAACERRACDCREAVERAYRELVGRGEPPDHALDAALTVLRWHHPEVAAPDAVAIVGRWVGPR
jgi:hypothetical protein